MITSVYIAIILTRIDGPLKILLKILVSAVYFAVVLERHPEFSLVYYDYLLKAAVIIAGVGVLVVSTYFLVCAILHDSVLCSCFALHWSKRNSS